MTIANGEGKREPPAPDADAARKRAAVETFSRHEEALRRTARRYSICADDADEALQRGLEILLRKAPSEDPRELIRWTQTVVRHEALAVRRERERLLAGPAARTPEPGEEDWVALIPADADGPAEQAERRETIARSREALQALKPQELRALTLLAEGYSYAEIAEKTSWSQTKINRCLAEGRERFRRLIAQTEDGTRCEQMRPLLSAFCDGEAGREDAAKLREHLRACAHCRAVMRAYRAAPAAAAALAPVLPLHRPLLERAHDALAAAATRFGGGGGDATLGSIGAGGGRGLGAAALAKLAAVCIGTAGGAAACVATGLVPAPLGIDAERAERPAHVAPRRVESTTVEAPPPAVKYEPAPQPAPEPEPEPEPEPKPEPQPEAAPPPSEPVEVAPEAPAASSGAVEYTPPPSEPAAAPPSQSSGGDRGNPGGEFGP